MKKLVLSVLFFLIWFTVGITLSTFRVSNALSVIIGFVAAWAFVVIASPKNTQKSNQ